MFLTVHTAAGLLIGKHVDSSVLAFMLGFISHLLLDMIPHDSIEIKKWKISKKFKIFLVLVFADFPLIIIMLSWLTISGNLIWTYPIGWAIVGAIILDFLWGFYWLLPKIKILKIFQWLNNFLHPPIFTNKLIYISWYKWLPIQLGFVVVLLVLFLLF